MMESDEDDISESQKGEENTRKRKITTKIQDKGEKSTSSIIEMSGHCCRNFQSGYPKRFWFRIFVDNRIIFESINYTVVCFADFQTTLVNEKI